MKIWVFERRHHDETKEGLASDNVRLKDANGFYIDITRTDHFPQDKTLIRMNVDDFEEGCRFLQDHGFHNAMGEGVVIVRSQSFNYTKWQQEHYDDMTPEQISSMMEEHSSKHPFKGKKAAVI